MRVERLGGERCRGGTAQAAQVAPRRHRALHMSPFHSPIALRSDGTYHIPKARVDHPSPHAAISTNADICATEIVTAQGFSITDVQNLDCVERNTFHTPHDTNPTLHYTMRSGDSLMVCNIGAQNYGSGLEITIVGTYPVMVL